MKGMGGSMSIHMIGIDYNRAELDVRGLFSFTKKGAVFAMGKFCQIPEISGCVILSTCNRTEIWVDMGQVIEEESCPMPEDQFLEAASCAVSQDEFLEKSPCLIAYKLYQMLSELKGIEEKKFFDAFVYREGREAVEHLFRLTSGMRSRILGEDQILTQVKEALALAHEHNYSDSTLEVLFRLAVTAGKQVKTHVIFPHGNGSAAGHAVKALIEKGYQIDKCRCMVIGNGQMGILAAREFREAGAQVLMTVRKYRHGQVEVPDGCEKIPFEERACYINQCDYIISATTSPHYVMTRTLFENSGYKNGLTVIDLAVPRDVEESVQELDGVQLFNIDDFKSDIKDEDTEKAIQMAEEILTEYIENFYQWLDGRNFVPRIQMLKEEIADDVLLRMQKSMRRISLSEDERICLQREIELAAEKAANKMLFGLKSYLTPEEFKRCVEGLERLYGEE